MSLRSYIVLLLRSCTICCYVLVLLLLRYCIVALRHCIVVLRYCIAVLLQMCIVVCLLSNIFLFFSLSVLQYWIEIMIILCHIGNFVGSYI